MKTILKSKEQFQIKLIISIYQHHGGYIDRKISEMINSYLCVQLLIKQTVTSERLNNQGVVAGHSAHARTCWDWSRC